MTGSGVGFAAYLHTHSGEKQPGRPQTAPCHLRRGFSSVWWFKLCGDSRDCPLPSSVRPGPCSRSGTPEVRCAPAPLHTRRKRGKVSQEAPRTTWHFTAASRYFVPPANTLLLNLCLHTRRASGKGAHPPYILKETHARAVTRWQAARCKGMQSSSDARRISVSVRDDGGVQDRCFHPNQRLH